MRASRKPRSAVNVVCYNNGMAPRVGDVVRLTLQGRADWPWTCGARATGRVTRVGMSRVTVDVEAEQPRGPSYRVVVSVAPRQCSLVRRGEAE